MPGGNAPADGSYAFTHTGEAQCVFLTTVEVLSTRYLADLSQADLQPLSGELPVGSLTAERFDTLLEVGVVAKRYRR